MPFCGNALANSCRLPRPIINVKDHRETNWYVDMMPSHRKALEKDSPMGAIMEELEKTKRASVPRSNTRFG